MNQFSDGAIDLQEYSMLCNELTVIHYDDRNLTVIVVKHKLTKLKT
jgi:hypothetical protein